MELNINTGRLNVPINRDGKRTGTLSFNPQDMDFVERFTHLLEEYEQITTDYRERLSQLDEADDQGYLALVREISQRICASIDALFGEGISDAAFGCVPSSPEVFGQFFEGLAEIIRLQRKPRLQAYLPPEEESAAGDALV